MIVNWHENGTDFFEYTFIVYTIGPILKQQSNGGSNESITAEILA